MRWIVRVGFGLALLVALAFGLVAMVPAERVASLLSTQFEAMTGRKLVLTGEVRPRVWPSLGVTTGPVEVANADWSEAAAPLFKAESLSVDINLGALIGGEVRIEGLTAVAPEVLLERAEDGRQNWTFRGAGGDGEVPAAATGFTLDQGSITGGSIRYLDHRSGQVVALDDVDATLAIPDLSGPFSLSLTGLSSGAPVALDATGGVFSAFAMGRVVPVTLNVVAGGSTLSFDGRGGLSPLAAEGALEANLDDLPALGALIGAKLEQPGQGLGQEKLGVSGQLTLDGSGAVFLRDARIVADENTLSGDLDLRPGEARPKLVGQLTAGAIAVGGEGGAAAPDGAASGWSDAEIDVSALGMLDAELALAAPSITANGLTLGETRVLVTIDRARAVTEIRKLEGYGGQIAGQFVVNGRGGLSVGGALTFANIDMQALLQDLAGYDRLVGRGEAEVNFLGVGNSVAAIMAGLKGDGALELGQGELRGFDAVQILQTLDPAYVGEDQKTSFDGLAGTFSIAGGVLSNSDLKLVAPSLTAAGSGEIDLGGRTLDYRLRPTALAAEDGTGGVMVPLMITGPWSDPKFRLDLESIAREKMEAEAKAAAKAAEERAKAELEERLKEELGVEVAPDESLGEAAQRGVEEAVEEEARELLEGLLNGN